MCIPLAICLYTLDPGRDRFEDAPSNQHVWFSVELLNAVNLEIGKSLFSLVAAGVCV